METKSPFLYDSLTANDLVLVEVLGKPKAQTYRCRIERIYSTGKAIDSSFRNAEIEFIGNSRWGIDELRPRDRLLIFMSATHGRFYESYPAHLRVEEIEGETYCIIEGELRLCEDFPAALREVSREDPTRPGSTAIRLDALEHYLMAMIERRTLNATMPRRFNAYDIVIINSANASGEECDGMGAVILDSFQDYDGNWYYPLFIYQNSAYATFPENRLVASGRREDRDAFVRRHGCFGVR